MNQSEIQIPFKKSLKSRSVKYIGKIKVKSYFTQETVRKNLAFSEEEEREFMESLNNIFLKNKLIIRE
ncbi:MAG: hypothetical protein ACTSO9_09110 [Candidatus Helarchaeota archaeon]